jgi:hypothetical protein
LTLQHTENIDKLLGCQAVRAFCPGGPDERKLSDPAASYGSQRTNHAGTAHIGIGGSETVHQLAWSTGQPKYYRWCYRRMVPDLAGQVDGSKENKTYQGLRLSTSPGNAPFTQLIK